MDYKQIQTEELKDLIQSSADLDQRMNLRKIIKVQTHTGPPVKIRCKCGHAQRYHTSVATEDWKGHCKKCNCKEFRSRPATV